MPNLRKAGRLCLCLWYHYFHALFIFVIELQTNGESLRTKLFLFSKAVRFLGRVKFNWNLWESTSCLKTFIFSAFCRWRMNSLCRWKRAWRNVMFAFRMSATNFLVLRASTSISWAVVLKLNVLSRRNPHKNVNKRAAERTVYASQNPKLRNKKRNFFNFPLENSWRLFLNRLNTFFILQRLLQ